MNNSQHSGSQTNKDFASKGSAAPLSHNGNVPRVHSAGPATLSSDNTEISICRLKDKTIQSMSLASRPMFATRHPPLIITPDWACLGSHSTKSTADAGRNAAIKGGTFPLVTLLGVILKEYCDMQTKSIATRCLLCTLVRPEDFDATSRQLPQRIPAKIQTSSASAAAATLHRWQT